MSKLPIHRAAAPKVHDKVNRGLKSLPQVELIRPWRGYAVGARIRPPGVLRQVLMQQKIAKMVEDKPNVIAKPPVNAVHKKTAAKKPAVKKAAHKKAAE